MPTFFAAGGKNQVHEPSALRAALHSVLDSLGDRRRVIAVPPDFTRYDSRAGQLTADLYDYYGTRLTDVLPALGTHAPMSAEQISRMFSGVPASLFRVHDWRKDVVTVGTLEAELVADACGGVWRRPWHAQLNRLVAKGGHDLIVSIGQVVPHEVAGIANHAKNLFIGTGGTASINESHFIGAAYGMERMMGRIDNPVRRLLDTALVRFCNELPILFVLTVVGAAAPGESADARGLVTRGLFIGTDRECFDLAARLSLEVNFTLVDEPLGKVVVHMDPEEFHSTWLANKSIYRTRMAIADGGELIVLAPSVGTFGEDAEIDCLIRKYGYRHTKELLCLVDEGSDLCSNLSAAAHLMHGSSDGRFRITYCPGKLSREEIERVGYGFGEIEQMQRRYDPTRLREGHNEIDGEQVFFIAKPALGLWAHRARFG